MVMRNLRDFSCFSYSKISLLLLDIITKELQKNFTKVTNSFQNNTSVSTTNLVGARKKSTSKNYWDFLTNGQTGEENTQKYQLYPLKKCT